MKLDSFLPYPQMPRRVILLQGELFHLRPSLADLIEKAAIQQEMSVLLLRAKNYFPPGEKGQHVLALGHKKCRDSYRAGLQNKFDLIIVDNKALVSSDLEPYWEDALEYSYKPTIVGVCGSGQGSHLKLPLIPKSWYRVYVKQNEIEELLQQKGDEHVR